MKPVIASLMLLLLSAGTYAQQPSVAALHGKVSDQTSHQPVAYATITLKNQHAKTIAGGMTGENGVFRLDSIPAGTYTLDLQCVGYHPLSRTISTTGTKSLDLGMILLVADEKLLKEIAIRGEQAAVSLKLDKKTYLAGKDVLSANGSANDLLNGVPSVAVSPTGAISLRGNSNVSVLINGRRTGLVQANMLDQLPADQIEKVEVIANPSARYDAAGSAGIINIVLRKNRNAGFNGQLKLIAGLPNDARISPSLNYKSDKINLFSTFGYRNSDYVGYYETNQNSSRPGSSAFTRIVQHENRHDDGKNLYLGADFYLSEQQTITAAFFKNATHDHDKTRLDYMYESAALMPDSTLVRNGRSSEVRDYNQLELNYTRNFKDAGKKWTIDLLYDFWNSDKDWNLETQKSFPENISFPAIRTSSDGSSKDLLVQTDLILPLSAKANLEMGLKGENRKVSSDFLAEQQTGDSWAVYQGIDNKLEYNEKIGSAYLQFGHHPGKFSYMLGLRTELTGIDINDRTKTYTAHQQYGRLFPSFSTSYQLKEKTTLQWNYSRRINRPSLSLLYPFNELTDLNAQFIGNPNLNPSFADVFELGFLQNWSVLTFNPSLYLQHTTGYIQDFTSRNAAGIFITTPVNLGSETRRGFELSLSFRPKSWLQFNGELNAYDFKQKGLYRGENLDFSGSALTSRLSLQVKLPEQFVVQARYNLTGKVNNAQSTTKAISFADIGLSKNLLKDKAAVVLDGTNIFNSRQTRRTTTGEDYLLNQLINFNAARYRLSFVYRFNSKADQSVRQARSGNRN